MTEMNDQKIMKSDKKVVSSENSDRECKNLEKKLERLREGVKALFFEDSSYFDGKNTEVLLVEYMEETIERKHVYSYQKRLENKIDRITILLRHMFDCGLVKCIGEKTSEDPEIMLSRIFSCYLNKGSREIKKYIPLLLESLGVSGSAMVGSLPAMVKTAPARVEFAIPLVVYETDLSIINKCIDEECAHDYEQKTETDSYSCGIFTERDIAIREFKEEIIRMIFEDPMSRFFISMEAKIYEMPLNKADPIRKLIGFFTVSDVAESKPTLTLDMSELLSKMGVDSDVFYMLKFSKKKNTEEIDRLKALMNDLIVFEEVA